MHRQRKWTFYRAPSGMDTDEATVSTAVSSVCRIDAADDMEYSFDRIEPIREGDEYANWRVHLRVKYGKIDAR